IALEAAVRAALPMRLQVHDTRLQRRRAVEEKSSETSGGELHRPRLEPAATGSGREGEGQALGRLTQLDGRSRIAIPHRRVQLELEAGGKRHDGGADARAGEGGPTPPVRPRPRA